MTLSSTLFGYNKTQVEELIRNKDSEIADLKTKVEVLQSQLNEYIEMESALKDGIVDARLTGNRIIEESTEEAQKLIVNTNNQISQYKEDFAHQSHDLINSGRNIQDLMNNMKQEMEAILAHYQSMLAEVDFDAYYPKNDVSKFADQVESYEQSSFINQESSKPRNWENTSISDEEKKELEKLIQEVIANEKNEKSEVSEDTRRIVKLVKM